MYRRRYKFYHRIMIQFISSSIHLILNNKIILNKQGTCIYNPKGVGLHCIFELCMSFMFLLLLFGIYCSFVCFMFIIKFKINLKIERNVIHGGGVHTGIFSHKLTYI